MSVRRRLAFASVELRIFLLDVRLGTEGLEVEGCGSPDSCRDGVAIVGEREGGSRGDGKKYGRMTESDVARANWYGRGGC